MRHRPDGHGQDGSLRAADARADGAQCHDRVQPDGSYKRFRVPSRVLDEIKLSPGALKSVRDGLWKVVNEQGGINGRKIDFVYYDDGWDQQKSIQLARRLVEQDKIFAMSAGCSLSEDQYQADLKRDQIPAFSPCSLYHVEWQNEYSFPIHMDMRQEGAATAIWAANTKKPKTYGVLCLNIPDSQAACDNVDKQMSKVGAKQVFKRTYRSGTPDMSGDVLAARAANPDMIFDYSIDAFVGARFYIDSHQQDYWPPMGIVANHKTIEPLGGIIGDYPAKKGYWTNTTYKLWGPELVSWSRKYIPDNEGLHTHVMQGQWWSTNVFFDVLKKMGPNVTREGLKQALETGEYTTGPGLDQKFMWSPKGRNAHGTGARREFMYKAVHSDWAATKDAAATPGGLVPDPDKFVIEDHFD